MLFGCKIQGADTTGEAPERGFLETGVLEYLRHLLSLREGLDGLRQITVCLDIMADQIAIERQDGVRVEAKELLHREALWRGQFDDSEATALLQHTAHLGQAFVEALEVADAKRGSDSIEGFVGERHVHTVFVDKGDDLSQSLSRSLLAPYLHHAFREVGASHLLGRQALGGKDGQIAGARSHIQNVLGAPGLQTVYESLAPAAVDAPRHQQIELVVGGRDGVKHALHHLAFLCLACVGLNLLLCVHSSTCG